MSQFFSINSA